MPLWIKLLLAGSASAATVSLASAHIPNPSPAAGSQLIAYHGFTSTRCHAVQEQQIIVIHCGK